APRLSLRRCRRRAGRVRHPHHRLRRRRAGAVAGGQPRPASVAALAVVDTADADPVAGGGAGAEGADDRAAIPQQGRRGSGFRWRGGAIVSDKAEPKAGPKAAGGGGVFLLVVLALAAFAVLIGLGTWQVQRLHWKEGLIAMIEARVASAPRPLAEIEALAAREGDVDYWPVSLSGTFRHEGERHFFATHRGQSGYFVYTPLALADGR